MANVLGSNNRTIAHREEEPLFPGLQDSIAAQFLPYQVDLPQDQRAVFLMRKNSINTTALPASKALVILSLMASLPPPTAPHSARGLSENHS